MVELNAPIAKPRRIHRKAAANSYKFYYFEALQTLRSQVK